VKEKEKAKAKASTKPKAKAKPKANAKPKAKVSAKATKGKLPVEDPEEKPAPTVSSGSPSCQAAGAERPLKKAKPSEIDDAQSQSNKTYILMKYAKHGTNGTWAVRKSGAHQVLEVNVPNASADQNKEIAEVVLNELNEKKVNEATVKLIAAKLKTALAEKLALKDK
jgi:hypothetical protein